MPAHEKPTTVNRKPSTEGLAEIVGAEPEHTNIQERHPDWPKLDVSFYFAPHDNSEDMQGVTEHLKDTDVLFIEGIAHDPEHQEYAETLLKVYNKVSTDPSADLEKAMHAGDFYDTSDEPMLRGIYRSGTIVDSIDLGETDDEQKLARRVQEVIGATHPLGLGYAETLEQFAAQRRLFAEVEGQREQVMADKFEAHMQQIFENHPELLDKENVKVLVTMGAAHTTLRHAFTDRGIESGRYFSQGGKTYIYEYNVELIRTYTYGKEPSEELVKRAFTQTILDQAITQGFMEASIPSDDYALYLRRYVSELSDEEMQKLFDLWNNRKATMANINALLVPAEMPPLAATAQEIREVNKLYEDRAKTLASAAIHASSN